MSAVWPSPEDYQSAVQNPKRYVSDARLHSAEVETRKLGALTAPYPRSGNFGAVYKFTNQRQAYALKVFLKAQPDREQRYQLIDQHLRRHAGSSGLVSFGYDAQGVLAKGRRYPTLIMDWVEGQTLDNYLIDIFRRRDQLDNRLLCQAWIELVLHLNERGIAHGDLQHGNILVLPNGALKLVDYDGMFVPAIKRAGLTAAEIGLPAYQHPKRYRGYFDERLDHFSALVILLCLASLNRPRWQRYHTDDNCLIVKESDLLNPAQSPVLTEVSQSSDAPLKKLANMLKAAASGSLDAIPHFAQIAADSTIKQLLSPGWRPTSSRSTTQEEQPQDFAQAGADDTAGTQLIRCPACGTSNRVPRHKLDQRFNPTCGRCKTALVKWCDNCTAELRPGEASCDRCGRHVDGTPPPPAKEKAAGWGENLVMSVFMALLGSGFLWKALYDFPKHGFAMQTIFLALLGISALWMAIRGFQGKL